MKNVYIIGAGAIGRVLALCLQAKGSSPILVRGRSNDLPKSLETYEVEFPGHNLQKAEIPTISLGQLRMIDGPVIVTVKSFANQKVAQALKAFKNEFPIVILQNGWDVEVPFLEAGFSRIFRSVLFVTSQIEASGLVRFKPVSPSPIGVVAGETSDLDQWVGMLDTAAFPFTQEEHIEKIVWEKAMINCAFNSICPLLETDNGIFKREPTAMAMAKSVVEECIHVSRHFSLDFQVDPIMNRIQTISEKSEGQLISTLQDINFGRETEIESLNLAIAKKADKLGLGEEVKFTRALGEMTLLKAKNQSNKLK